MIYFFHHYELPVIIRQAQLQQIIIRNRTGGGVGGGLGGGGGAGGGGGGGHGGGGGNNGQPPGPQQPRPGGLLGMSYRDPRQGDLVASIRLRPYRPTMNNNNVDAQNNNTINAARTGLVGGVAAPVGNNAAGINPREGGRPGRTFALPGWNQEQTIIGNIRHIALTAGRIVRGPGNNNNNASGGGNNTATATNGAGTAAGPLSGDNQGGGGGGYAAASVGVSDSREEQIQLQRDQQHHHHHHHHHHHVHRRLPTIMNLAHLQRISLGRITISPQFTGTPDSGSQNNEVAEGRPGNEQVGVVGTRAGNNGCNESEASTTAESAPEMESNARGQESNDSDPSAATVSSSTGNGGDLIIERGDKLSESVAGIERIDECEVEISRTTEDVVAPDAAVMEVDEGGGEKIDLPREGGGGEDEKRGKEGMSIDKSSSMSTEGRVPEAELGCTTTAGPEVVRAGGSSDQKTEGPRLGVVSAGEKEIKVPDEDDGWQEVQECKGSAAGEEDDGEVDKLVNLNVNCNQRMLNSTLNGVLGDGQEQREATREQTSPDGN